MKDLGNTNTIGLLAQCTAPSVPSSKPPTFSGGWGGASLAGKLLGVHPGSKPGEAATAQVPGMPPLVTATALSCQVNILNAV